MRLSCRTKHLLHCALSFAIILTIQHFRGGLNFGNNKQLDIDPFKEYGHLLAWFLYSLRFVSILSLLFLVPIVFSTFFGLIFYNAFQDKVKLKFPPNQTPFICFRTVTRGDFAELVNRNVNRNLDTCLSVGLENFVIEVVTDKTIELAKHQRIKEVVVPKDYRTKTGALFKARALQFCLEKDNNQLNDDDWIVHLDEETILTKDSVRGIINFVSAGKHEFGQGLVTYADEEVVNWFTTLADTFRLAEDLGKVRFQFKMFHRPLFGWKGSFMVCKSSAERAVSFDNGPDGSICEDIFFALIADVNGYSFGFIDGRMHEKSPFTVHDLYQQRKRWTQGLYLVVKSNEIPLKNKLLLVVNLLCLFTIPFQNLDAFVSRFYPIPLDYCINFFNFLSAFFIGFSIYVHIFGVIKSFSFDRLGAKKFILCLIAVSFVIPFNLFFSCITFLCALFGRKHNFYVVQKQTTRHYKNF